jgi:hypothetical protein
MSFSIPVDPRVVAAAFVVIDMYFLALWCYGILRTRLLFFWILALAGLVYVLLAIANAALIYDAAKVRTMLGLHFATFYAIFLAVQPLNLVFAAIGHTILVRWVIRSQRQHSRNSSGLTNR